MLTDPRKTALRWINMECAPHWLKNSLARPAWPFRRTLPH
jgi:hypothetical protein